MTATQPTPSLRRRRILRAAAVVALLAIVAVVVDVTVVSGSSGPSYRTATVQRATVDQTIDGSGTLAPVSEAAVAFPVAGTVAAVNVGMGQTVSAGEPLATLQTQSLEAQLASAQAALAKAQLELQRAESGQATSLGSGSSSGSFGGAAYDGGPNSLGQIELIAARTTTPMPNSGLAAAQQQVVQAQQQVDQSLATAQHALTSATSACTTTEAASPSSTSTSTSTPTPSGTSTPTSAACTSALSQALAAQQSVAQAEQALAQRESSLNSLLGQSVSNSGSSGSTGSSRSSGAAGSSGPTGSSRSTGSVGGRNGAASSSNGASGNGPSSKSSGPRSTPSAGSTGATNNASRGATSASQAPTAQQLAADQATIDADTAKVSVAQQALDQATITSPINGTVVAVGLQAGQQVTAASSTDHIVVAGQDGYEVATTVSVYDLDNVKVGDAANVVVDGTNNALSGTVVSIGVAANTSGATATYPVVIGFSQPPPAARNGTMVTTSIVTKRAHDALTVPTSAVRSAGPVHTVTVLSGGHTSVVAVGVGAMGVERTEITSGLRAGQQVVLADLHEPLPSNQLPSRGPGGLGGGGGLGRFGG